MPRRSGPILSQHLAWYRYWRPI